MQINTHGRTLTGENTHVRKHAGTHRTLTQSRTRVVFREHMQFANPFIIVYIPTFLSCFDFSIYLFGFRLLQIQLPLTTQIQSLFLWLCGSAPSSCFLHGLK